MSLKYNLCDFDYEKEDIIKDINKNFDKEELVNDLRKVLELANLLKNRIKVIKDEREIVIKADVWNKKEGNKKYVYFCLNRVIKLKDNKNIKYVYTGKVSDMNIERKKFNYKKSDKKTQEIIKNFYDYILEKYKVDNIEQFKNDFERVFDF